MSKVFFDISMSLDGFMTAANQRPEEPMGDGGLKLVEWAFGQDERDRAVLTDGIAGTGAVIAGRRTYDDSLPWWGADGPTGEARVYRSSCSPTARPTMCPTEACTPSSTGSSVRSRRPERPPATRT
jgi:dihydrofolate reductase